MRRPNMRCIVRSALWSERRYAARSGPNLAEVDDVPSLALSARARPKFHTMAAPDFANFDQLWPKLAAGAEPASNMLPGYVLENS